MMKLSERITALSPDKLVLFQQRLTRRRSAKAMIASIPRRGPGSSWPLSSAQQRLWFFEQFEPGTAVYVLSGQVRLRAVNVAALERSINEIVRRHEALRTTFTSVEGRPVQVIAPITTAVTIALPVIDLRQLGPSERQVEAARLAHEEGTRPFDLARGPLLRTKLLRWDDREYELLLSMHHIVSDGWSIGVFTRELSTLYDAFVQDRPSPLAELPIQYADFAQWQREQLQGDMLQAHLSYFRDRLAGAPAVLSLPTDHPRPAVQSYRGAAYGFTLPGGLSESIKALTRQEGATLFMTLLSGFAALLHRYAGQSDVLVGSPIANRTRAELEGLIGFFVNTLVLRCDLSGDPSFRQLVRRVKDMTLEAYAHQDLPFERLVEELRPERSLSHNPLFQVVFAVQNTPTTSKAPPRAPSEATQDTPQVKAGTAKFDLGLFFTESDGGLAGTIEYCTDLWDAGTIARMAQHLEVLLGGAVAEPDRSVAELPVLTEPERRRIVVEWNATAAEIPRDCAHTLFEHQARRTPDAIAVVGPAQPGQPDQQVTYAELDRRSNQLARYLQAQRVGPEVRVGVCLDRSPMMVTAVLGVLKAGGTYVPLDPAYPSERLAYMLEDASVAVLVSQASRAKGLPEHRARLVGLDTDGAAIAEMDDAALVDGARPDNLAYVIYTSGSTGKPKGVMLEHRGLANLAVAQRMFGVTAEHRVLQYASPGFDASIFEVLLALCAGAELHVAPQDSLLPGPALLALLRDRAISVAVLPPSVLAILVGEELPALRTVIAAGERCPLGVVRRWAPGRRLFNAYGPTEATIWVSVAACDPAAERVSVGRPIANTRMFILDQRLQPVPVGVNGELHIGDIGVARGYLNQPGLTTERFIADPFSAEPDARLYRTGDIARYLLDGSVEILGRLDEQVKIRGVRIELGEVEAAVRQHPMAQDAAVVAREDLPDDKRLIAYIVHAGVQAPGIETMRDFLKTKLPEQMVPSAFIWMDALPRLPNGKVDRRALPAPDASRPELEQGFEAPRTPTEQALARIWAEAMGLDRVGIHDDFFALGGHSLMAMKIAARLRDALHLELPLRHVFETPTIAGIAATLDARAATLPDRTIVPPASPAAPSLVADGVARSDRAAASGASKRVDREQREELSPMDIAHMSDEQVTAALRELLRAEQELARPVAATPSPAAPPPATPTPATPMAPSYVTPAAAAMQSTPPSTAQHIPTAMPDVPSPVAQDAPAAVPPVAMQYMPSVMPATWGTEGAWGQQAQPPSWITTAQGTQQRILKAQQDYQRSLARAWLPDQVWQRLEDALRAYKRAVSEALGQPDTQAITPSTIAMLAQVMMNTAAAIDPGKDADGRPAATPER